MNKKVIKKLAKITASQKRVDKNTSDLVFNSFNRKQLSSYLVYLKKEIEEKSVRVFSSIDLPQTMKNEITHMFAGKEVIFHIDSEMGDGMRVQINDTIIDLSARAYLEQTIDQIKE